MTYRYGLVSALVLVFAFAIATNSHAEDPPAANGCAFDDAAWTRWEGAATAPDVIAARERARECGADGNCMAGVIGTDAARVREGATNALKETSPLMRAVLRTVCNCPLEIANLRCSMRAQQTMSRALERLAGRTDFSSLSAAALQEHLAADVPALATGLATYCQNAESAVGPRRDACFRGAVDHVLQDIRRALPHLAATGPAVRRRSILMSDCALPGRGFVPPCAGRGELSIVPENVRGIAYARGTTEAPGQDTTSTTTTATPPGFRTRHSSSHAAI